jgi:hypothetical protein
MPTPYVDQAVVDKIWRDLAAGDIRALLLAEYGWPDDAREFYEVVHRGACRGEKLETILKEKIGEMHRRGAGQPANRPDTGESQNRPWVWFAPIEDVAAIRLEQAYLDHLRPIATTPGMKTAVQRWVCRTSGI